MAGVGRLSKLQWFGGYYRDPSNFFAQFAVDPDLMLDTYPECELDAESRQRFFTTRNGCIVGKKLADEFQWEIGETIPLTGALFPKPGGGAWEFVVSGIYTSKAPNFDERTMMFGWKYFEETLRADGQDPGVGIYVFRVGPGGNVERVMREVETMFENGPMAVRCAPESEFQRMFISMMGDIPMLLGWIGAGVFIALLMACVNTMLMAGREQMHDVGIYKALGFTNGAAFRVMLTQSLLLCTLGGLAGIAMTLMLQPLIAKGIQQMFPVFLIANSTLIAAVVLTIFLGVVAGLMPAWRAIRLKPVDALRADQ